MTDDIQQKSVRPSYAYYKEELGSKFYRYESITVWSSSSYTAPQADPAAGLALIAAGTVTALYTIVGAVFWTRYSRTRFQNMAKWKLTLLWPFLYMFNAKFRAEFNCAVTGKRKPGCGSDDVSHASRANL